MADDDVGAHGIGTFERYAIAPALCGHVTHSLGDKREVDIRPASDRLVKALAHIFAEELARQERVAEALMQARVVLSLVELAEGPVEEIGGLACADAGDSDPGRDREQVGEVPSGFLHPSKPRIGGNQHPEAWAVVGIGGHRLTRPDQGLFIIVAHQLNMGEAGKIPVRAQPVGTEPLGAKKICDGFI